MKRLRLEKWSGQLLSARPGAATSSRSRPRLQAQGRSSRHDQFAASSLWRCQSTSAASARDIETEIKDAADETAATTPQTPSAQHQDPASISSTTTSITQPPQWPKIDPSQDPGPIPSPGPKRALRSAKLAALHARLALSDKIPLQTLARTLVDPSADPAPLFNNSNLAFLGQTLISYHTSEMLMCKYPRLPMEIMYSAMKAYAGDRTLFQIARSWGVESAAAPGAEVDPGLLQFSFEKTRAFNTKWGFVRSEYQHKYKYRRGISSRVVMDDDFGEVIPREAADESMDQIPEVEGVAKDVEQTEDMEDEDDRTSLPMERQLSLGDPDEKTAKSHNIHGTFVRAVVGAIYTHSGREAAQSFVKSHILSRQLDLAKLFTFKLPVRELARLCMREEFEPPVARLLSETGRLSRTPVFVVGIFSGNDKLGEGAASSLDFARKKAAMNALKAWYLYSPGEDVRVPSDMMTEGARTWEPVYVDIGEVVTSGV